MHKNLQDKAKFSINYFRAEKRTQMKFERAGPDKKGERRI